MKTLTTIASFEHPEYLDYLFSRKSPFWDMGIESDVLLVNNGSISNHYYETLKKYQNDIMVDHKENFGRELSAFSFAERKYENYDRYMFLQHDVKFLKSSWLKIFKTIFESDNNCGAVGMKIRAVRSNPNDAVHFATGINGHECDDILHNLIGSHAKLDKFCGGSILYTSRSVLDHLRKYGGIQFVNVLENTPNFHNTPEYHRMFTTERLFGSMIENIGYNLLEATDVLINGYAGR